MFTRRFLVVVLLGLCCNALLCGAVTQRPLGLAELVSKANVIVIGTVTNRTAAWNPEHTSISTQVTLQIEETLKGVASGTIVVETPGGVVGGVGMMAAGAPVFRRGERSLIFLTRGPRVGVYHVFGWSQGRFQISRDAAGGRERVSRNLAGVILVPHGATSSSGAHIEYLDELKLAIRQLQGR